MVFDASGVLLDLGELGELFDELVSKEIEAFALEGSLLDWEIEENAKLCRVEIKGENLKYSFSLDWPDEISRGGRTKERQRLVDTLLRAGIAGYTNLQEDVMEKIRRDDDVILAPDTNVILNCAFTSVLLEEFFANDFPNWVLLAIPKMVMAEIENKSNNRIKGKKHLRAGWPSYDGRVGQRGIQEIIELDKPNPERPGFSIMTIGELSGDSRSFGKKENWWKDSEIRTQFRDFVRNIDFYKGTYFLSGDRVNAMMSSAEGIEGLYLQKPDFGEIERGRISRKDFLRMLYELSVQFGEVRVDGEGDVKPIGLSIFWPQKHVSDWENSRLKIIRGD